MSGSLGGQPDLPFGNHAGAAGDHVLLKDHSFACMALPFPVPPGSESRGPPSRHPHPSWDPDALPLYCLPQWCSLLAHVPGWRPWPSPRWVNQWGHLHAFPSPSLSLHFWLFSFDESHSGSSTFQALPGILSPAPAKWQAGKNGRRGQPWGSHCQLYHFELDSFEIEHFSKIRSFLWEDK